MKRDKGFPSEATLDLIRSLYCKRKATGTRDALRSEISTRLERFTSRHFLTSQVQYITVRK